MLGSSTGLHFNHIRSLDLPCGSSSVFSPPPCHISGRSGPGPQTPATVVDRVSAMRQRPGHHTIYYRRATGLRGEDAVPCGLASATTPRSLSCEAAASLLLAWTRSVRSTPSNWAGAWHRGGAAPVPLRSGTRSAPRAESSPEAVRLISCGSRKGRRLSSFPNSAFPRRQSGRCPKTPVAAAAI